MTFNKCVCCAKECSKLISYILGVDKRIYRELVIRSSVQQGYYKLFCNKNENKKKLREYLGQIRDTLDSTRYPFFMVYKSRKIIHTKTPYKLLT